MSKLGSKKNFPGNIQVMAPSKKAPKKKLIVPDDAEDRAEAKKGLFNAVEEKAENRGGKKHKVRITTIKTQPRRSMFGLK